MSDAVNPAASPPPRWYRVSWKRVVIVLGAIFLCMMLPLPIMQFFEPWYFAHEMGRNNPSLAVSPAPLRDVSRSPLAPARLQRFEFSFQTPWALIDARKDAKTVSVIRFKDGPGILAFDPAVTSTLSGDIRNNAEKLRSVFGPRALSSGYDWMAAELSATPSDIHWWNRSGNVRAGVLLGLKQIEVMNSTAIYRIANDELHGFQLGDAAEKPMRIRLELFDVSGRRYELIIASTANSSRAVTQADINAIVASMQPIPHS